MSRGAAEVFFLFFEKANYPSARPVMQRLHTEGRLRPVFVKGFDFKEYMGEISPLVPDEAFETVDIHDFFDSAEMPLVETAAAADLSLLRDLPAGGEFAERAARMLLRREMDRPWMPEVMRRFHIVSFALRRFLTERRPGIVVLPEDTDYVRGRLAAQMLAATGARIVVLAPVFYNLFRSYPLTGRRYADRYLTGNQFLRERLIDSGVSESAIAVTGFPAFDELSGVRIRKQPRFTVLFAAQGFASDRAVVRDLIDVFRRLPDCRLLVKPHPDSPIEAENSVEVSNNVELVRDAVPLVSMLERISCLVAQTSTALYQAALAGLPVIAAHYRPGPFEIDVPEAIIEGAMASNRAELEKRLLEARAGALAQAAPDSFQPGGFDAAGRAAREIEAVARA